MILFVNKTGSNTMRNTGGITRGGVQPNGGGYVPNPLCCDVTAPVTAQ